MASLIGTVRSIPQPKIQKKIVYNGYKKQHALKHQSMTTSNGIIANLYDPAEGKRHDVTMFKILGLMHILEKFIFGASPWKSLYISRSSIPFKTVFTSTIQGNIPYATIKSFQW